MSIFYFGAILVLILELISHVHGHNSSSCYHPEKVPAQAQKNDTPMIVSAYYPGYNSKFLPVEKIPWKMYNHLQYFVAVPDSKPEEDLIIETEENMIQVIKAAKQNKVSISLSVGGWTGSRTFSFLVGDSKNRTSFVETIARAVHKYGLDGIDLGKFTNLFFFLLQLPLIILLLLFQLIPIEEQKRMKSRQHWEYPNEQGLGCNALNANDTKNFLAFLKLLRKKLGTSHRLSAAVSMKGFMSPDGQNYLSDVSEFAKVLNFFTIMAYDVYGSSFSKLAGPNSPLYSTCSEPTKKFSVAQTIKQWTSTGIPSRQLLLGIPSYGYAYTLLSSKITPSHLSGQPGVTSLLFQPHADTVPESGKTAGQAGGTDACGNPNVAGGQWLFKELSETGKLSNDQQKGLNGYRRIYDNCTHTPFLFNPSTKNLISYDDSFSLKEKASYALEHGLGGVEMFDATGDTPDSQLLRSVRRVLFPGEKNALHGIRATST
ncbi:hypothetical protein PCASD_13837 [Puccinia coronata f. sp. avenae]|uniref:GH18 domain-containing protein n=1 Tax=Puccinia coronata f. sp. avenae TaxID=200324 RepID=A0A2N5T332_9BASI|nr:hypothetical protein PCASD_13837 [Puccinia coronata f. sp. avenae]